jgi:hypothetical protein
MSIQSTSYSKQLQAYELAHSRISSLITDTKDLPKPLKDKLIELKNLFKSYDMSQHKTMLKVLEGKILSNQEILEIVKDATGYTKWSENRDMANDFGNSFTWLSDHFGVDVENSEVRYLALERSTHSRNEIFLIQFYILPGNVYVEMDTGRANWGSDMLLSNDDIAKYLQRQMD